MTVLTPVGLAVTEHGAVTVQQPHGCSLGAGDRLLLTHVSGLGWEVSLSCLQEGLGAEPELSDIITTCSGLMHWIGPALVRGVLGWLWGLCCRADPPCMVCADVASAEMRLEEAVSISHRPG